MFHRYKQPTYFGALALPAGPATVTFNGIQYNLINAVSEGVGMPHDNAAFVDGAKDAGPNEGTYLVAHGEDAKSRNANRGLVALARNTDTLDDWFHRDLAVSIRTELTLSGVSTTSVVLPAQTFVGTSNTTPLSSLFSVLNSTDEEILNGSTKVSVVGISGATIGSGFSANPITIFFSAPIPSTMQYRIGYSTRSNLASLPVDTFLIPKPNEDEVSTPVQNAIRALKGEYVDGASSGLPTARTTPWSATPLFSLRALGHNGLNGLYRRQTILDPVGSLGPQLDLPNQASIDTPGAGRVIRLDGPAVELQVDAGDFAPEPFDPAKYPDPTRAALLVRDVSSKSSNRIGFVSLSNVGHGFASFASNLFGDGQNASDRTALSPNDGSVAASLQTDPSGLFFYRVTLPEGYRFKGASGSNVVVGQDVLTLFLPSVLNGQPVTHRAVSFRIMGITSNTEAVLTTLDGKINTFLATNLAAATSVGLAGWHRQSSEISHSWLWHARENSNFVTHYNALITGGMAVPVPGGTNATFVAQTTLTAPTPNNQPVVAVHAQPYEGAVALQWGTVRSDTSGLLNAAGRLFGDGSVYGNNLVLAGSADVSGSLSALGNFMLGGDLSMLPGNELQAGGVNAEFNSLVLASQLQVGGNTILQGGASVAFGTTAASYRHNLSGTKRVTVLGPDAAVAATAVTVRIPRHYQHITFVVQSTSRTTAFTFDLYMSSEYVPGDTLTVVVIGSVGQANYLTQLRIFQTAPPPGTALNPAQSRATGNSALVGAAASASGSALKFMVATIMCVGKSTTNNHLQWELVSSTSTNGADNVPNAEAGSTQNLNLAGAITGDVFTIT